MSTENWIAFPNWARVIGLLVGIFIYCMVCWGPKKWDPENAAHFSISDQDPSELLMGPRTTGSERPLIVSWTANLLNTGRRVATNIVWTGYIIPQDLSDAAMSAYRQNASFRTTHSSDEVPPGGKRSMVSELLRPVDYLTAAPSFYIVATEYSDGLEGRRLRQNFFLKWSDPKALTKDAHLELMSATEVSDAKDFLKAIGHPLPQQGEVDNRSALMRWLTR